MKTLQIFMILFLSICLTITGCKKDESTTTIPVNNNGNNNNSNQGGVPTSNNLKVEINGTAKTFNNKLGSIADSNSISIKGWGQNGEHFTIKIYAPYDKKIKKGAYQLEFSADYNVSIYWYDGNDFWSCPESNTDAKGVFEVTYYDGEKIAGKFSGKLANSDKTGSYNISNGTFSLKKLN